LRYRVQFTASQEYVDRLEEARDLLQHQVPDRDVARTHELAMAVFVEHLKKRRQAASDRPRRRGANDGPAAKRVAETSGSDGTARERRRGSVDEHAPERVAQASGCDEAAPERVLEASAGDEHAPERLEAAASGGSAPERVTTWGAQSAEDENRWGCDETTSACGRHVPAA